MKRKVVTTLGIACIVLGLLAFFTPLTPGSWLFLIGLELLGLRLIVSKDDRHSMWERFKSIRIRRKKDKIDEPPKEPESVVK